ncbi:MAG: DNA methyltransferase, partial [Hydrogenobaculum sp.]
MEPSQPLNSSENGSKHDSVKKLQIAKELANKLIDLIGSFEDEILKLWNMPKTVVNANYVITLDKIAMHNDKGTQMIDKILSHKNIKEQIEEWKDLRIVDDVFSTVDIKTDFEKYKHLPIDTRYFKDIETNIIDLFDNLDNALDGWLIKSENYQALNTLLPKFKEKVQTIYIDPPFNLESSDQFFYRTNYKDSTWATLLENRLRLAKDWLNEKGSIFV